MTPAQRSIWHIGTVFVLLLLLLSCRMVYWQVVNERAFKLAFLRTMSTETVGPDRVQAPTPGSARVPVLTTREPSSARRTMPVVQPAQGSTAMPEVTVPLRSIGQRSCGARRDHTRGMRGFVEEVICWSMP
jgi:hypothetical protein